MEQWKKYAGLDSAKYKKLSPLCLLVIFGHDKIKYSYTRRESEYKRDTWYAGVKFTISRVVSRFENAATWLPMVIIINILRPHFCGKTAQTCQEGALRKGFLGYTRGTYIRTWRKKEAELVDAETASIVRSFKGRRRRRRRRRGRTLKRRSRPFVESGSYTLALRRPRSNPVGGWKKGGGRYMLVQYSRTQLRDWLQYATKHLTYTCAWPSDGLF